MATSRNCSGESESRRRPTPLLFLLLASCRREQEERATEEVQPAVAASLPTDEDIAAACYRSPAEMAQLEAEEAGRGVHIEPTYDEYLVRAARCAWRAQRPKTAQCRFEVATIPLHAQDEPERSRHLARLGHRRWEPAAALLTHHPVLGWREHEQCRLRSATLKQ